MFVIDSRTAGYLKEAYEHFPAIIPEKGQSEPLAAFLVIEAGNSVPRGRLH